MGIVVLLDRWIWDGRLSSAILAIAMLTMLMNFCASGGIGFAAVAQSLWLLAALLLNHTESNRDNIPKSWMLTLGRWQAAALTIGVGVLLTCFHQTAYSPVTQSQTLIIEGNTRHMLGQSNQALAAYRQAAKLDPFSPEPWEHVDELASALWLRTGDPSFEETFREAARESLKRNAHSSHAHMQVGHRWLAAYRRFNRRDCLQEAIRCYGIAVERYPNYNLGRAQFAWSLHLMGDEKAAEWEADEALRLDAWNPHKEQKLSKQRVFDVVPSHSAQPASAADRTAEQIALEIRNR
jgi:tetratricopeptide (TPR) repeat protein